MTTDDRYDTHYDVTVMMLAVKKHDVNEEENRRHH